MGAYFASSTISKIALNGTATPVATGRSYEHLAVDVLGNIFATVNVSSSEKLTKFSPSGTWVSFPTNDRHLGALTVGISGDLYACTSYDKTVIKISPSGTVTLVAGVVRQAGYADGATNTALFYSCRGIAVDGSGNVFVSDRGNNVTRKITPNGVVSTVAGNSASNDTVMGAFTGGLYRPTHLAFHGDDSLLVTVNGVAVVRIRLPWAFRP